MDNVPAFPAFPARGFTLIELLVVLTIVALLLTLAVPRFGPRIDSARETVLRENLRTTRAVIDQFRSDTGRYPASLDELVARGYLPAFPFDPVADSSGAWILVEEREGGEQGIDGQGGLRDLHSGAAGSDRHGSPYQSW